MKTTLLRGQLAFLLSLFVAGSLFGADPVATAVKATATSGSATVYAGTPSPTISAYVTGNLYQLKIDVANTGTATVNLGPSAVAIDRVTAASGLAALSGGEMQIGQYAQFVYNGTVMILLNPSQVAGGGGGSPGGAPGSIEYNNAGSFGGFGAWDGTNFLAYLGDGSGNGFLVGKSPSAGGGIYDFGVTPNTDNFRFSNSGGNTLINSVGGVGVIYGGNTGTTIAAWASDHWEMDKILSVQHVIAGIGPAPTIASGFGTSPAIAGAGDSSFHVTVGSIPSTTGTVTFGTPYATYPNVMAQQGNNTVVSTSKITLVGSGPWTGFTITVSSAMTAGDTWSFVVVAE